MPDTRWKDDNVTFKTDKIVSMNKDNREVIVTVYVMDNKDSLSFSF